jgi:hypothetical protein
VDKTMLHQLIRRLGVWGITILITILSILISVILRIIISFAVEAGEPLIPKIMIAALIPLIIAPIMSVIFVRLLKQIDEAEQRNAQLVDELQAALAKAKTLSGLLPICASCKKIRDDAGYWHQVEVYIRDHAEVNFSHGLCPECAKAFQAQIAQYKNKS